MMVVDACVGDVSDLSRSLITVEEWEEGGRGQIGSLEKEDKEDE